MPLEIDSSMASLARAPRGAGAGRPALYPFAVVASTGSPAALVDPDSDVVGLLNRVRGAARRFNKTADRKVSVGMTADGRVGIWPADSAE